MAAKPYTIIERSGIKIGIIGLTNPNAPRWDGEKTDPFIYAPVGPAARKVVDIIKDKVDVIIVAAHVGLYPEYDEEGGSDGANSILELCPEVDVLIVGHDHNAIKEIRGNTVIGGARNLGREVIRIDLALNEKREIVDRRLNWSIWQTMNQVIPSERTPSSPKHTRQPATSSPEGLPRPMESPVEESSEKPWLISSRRTKSLAYPKESFAIQRSWI
jgi:2',3'-cyclic-nucleotide 2'-phosphodiesterase (5'-nucleotidase family)